MAPAEEQMERQRATVVAVDDHEACLAAVRRVVATAGFELVGEASSGEDAVTTVVKLAPDMVLMDVAMDGIGVVAAAREIKSRAPATVVVLVSATPSDELAHEARRCRAEAVVWKPHLRPQLLQEIWRNRHDPPSGGGDTHSGR
jgi:DNA-binding NarL/FixJ family response regulator